MNIEFKLEAFEGPMELLLHLIEKNKIDIYDIPIKELTEQYMAYISDFSKRDMENMSEFLVMAATLIEIKSNMLLPKSAPKDDEDETDPREELVRRLIEYKKAKKAAEFFYETQKSAEVYIFKKPDTDIILKAREASPPEISEILDGVDLAMLYEAFRDVLKRQDVKRDKIRGGFNSVNRDLFTVEDKIQYISDLLFLKKEIKFSEAFKKNVSKPEVVVTFLAVLELIKIKKVFVKQYNNLTIFLFPHYDGKSVAEGCFFMKIDEKEAIIEAVLFAAGEAVSFKDISLAADIDISEAVDITRGLIEKYKSEGRGISIIEAGDSFQMCTNIEYFKNVKSIYDAPRKKQLTPSILETLAIIAYKQPVTRGNIEEIRGVNSDRAVNKLVEYNLVSEKGRLDAPGKPILFGTTDEFLKYFGFSNLDGLPVIDGIDESDIDDEAENFEKLSDK